MSDEVMVLDPLVSVELHFTAGDQGMRRKHRWMTDAVDIESAIAPVVAACKAHYGEDVWITQVHAERMR